MRRPPVVLGLAALTMLALLIALGLILFSVNPGVDKNEEGLETQQVELRKAVMSQHAIICAQVQNTANSYRFRSLTPSGNVEPIRHFLTRMQAQQQTLRLARGSECRSAPGFPPVGLQVRRALRQIHGILQHFEPKLRRPVAQGVSHLSPGDSGKQESLLQRVPKPSNAGIDESGVPAHLHDQLAPSAPAAPHAGSSTPAPEGRTAPVSPAPQEAPLPVAPLPEAAQEEGSTRVENPGRPELPQLPIKVEIQTEGLNVEVHP